MTSGDKRRHLAQNVINHEIGWRISCAGIVPIGEIIAGQSILKRNRSMIPNDVSLRQPIYREKPACASSLALSIDDWQWQASSFMTVTSDAFIPAGMVARTAGGGESVDRRHIAATSPIIAALRRDKSSDGGFGRQTHRLDWRTISSSHRLK